jgi:peptidoglycan hydrolase-like protein with peptidoglycan-binding domain
VFLKLRRTTHAYAKSVFVFPIHQEMLNVAIDDDRPLKVDGLFGPKTKARVVQFQKTFKLFADGVVGPKTAKALVAAVLDAVQDNA